MNGEEFFANLRCEIPLNTKGENKMSNKFIKTVTTQTVKEMRDSYGPCSIAMSVVPTRKGEIKLVIGAAYSKGCSCYITSKGLRDLAKELVEIAEVMDKEELGF